MRVIFRIFGEVQGVGFRWFVRDAASGRGLTGLVRNLPDGTVEGEAQGEKKELDSFIRELKAGPPAARVTRAEVREIKELQAETDFVIDTAR